MRYTTIRLAEAATGLKRWTFIRAMESGDLDGERRGHGRDTRIAIDGEQGIEAWFASKYPQCPMPEFQSDDVVPPKRAAMPLTFSLKEVAEEHGISYRALLNGAKNREFDHIPVGRAYRMTPEQIEKLLAQKTVPACASEVPLDPLDAIRRRRARQLARAS